jgi:c-di-GMP-binding flagellar brake protein YcgR
MDMKKNEELIIVCATESGIYKFPVRVTSIEHDPIRLTLSLLRGTVHVQRREFFRLSRPLIRARYRPVSGPEDILTTDLIEAPVKDLSGNGLSFIIDQNDELPSGVPLRAELELGNRQVVSLIGQVVRCIPNEPINGKSLLCVHFALIDEHDRDRIVGQLFKEQIDRAGKRRRSPRRY